MRSVTRSGGFAATLSAVLLAGSFSIAGAAPPDGGGSSGTGDEFADLVVILRDEDGVPILKDFEVPSEIEGETEVRYCVQPISSVALPGGVADVVNPVDGRTVYPIPLMGDPGAPPPPEGEEVEVCDPQPAYAVYVAEAELERLNMARQPDKVFQRKVNDVELKLLTGTEITLDGAGRITVDGVPIDASPEHAAMYRTLMTTGAIPGLGVEPAVVDPFDTWMLAAASMGTAAGKETQITVDTVQYYNRIATEIPEEYVSIPGWDLEFLSNAPNDPEQFVDFGDFDYARGRVPGMRHVARRPDAHVEGQSDHDHGGVRRTPAGCRRRHPLEHRGVRPAGRRRPQRDRAAPRERRDPGLLHRPGGCEHVW